MASEEKAPEGENEILGGLQPDENATVEIEFVAEGTKETNERNGKDLAPDEDKDDVPGAAAATKAKAAGRPSLAPVAFSKATQHEHEAETILMAAIETERRKTMKPTRRVTLKPNTPIGDPMPSTTSETPKKKADPSLAEAAEYLKNLQDGTGETGTFDDEPSKDLADTDPTDRITRTASLFKAAATRSKKSQQIPTEQEPAAEDGQNQLVRPEGAVDVESGNGASPEKSKISTMFLAWSAAAKKQLQGALSASSQEWASLHDFFAPKRSSLMEIFVFWVTTFMIPCMCTALILFYGVDNPPTGKCDQDRIKLEDEEDPCSNAKASASWWLIFIGVRHVIMMLLARVTDLLVVDFLVLQHPWIVRLIGARMSLLVVQSKGWPSILFWWSVWTSILLYGSGNFPQYWLYWQEKIEIFSKTNPSGHVTDQDLYRSLIVVSIIVPVLTTLKRHFVGLHLGARLYTRFNKRLSESLREVLLISELSLWVRRKRDETKTYDEYLERAKDEDATFDRFRDDENQASPGADGVGSPRPSDPKVSINHASFAGGEIVDFSEILEPWEEPKRGRRNEDVSGKHIIEFRQAFSVVTRPFFFSSAFGPVDSREQCAKSAEMLFRRLLKVMNDGDSASIDLDKVVNWMYHGCHKPEEKENAETLREIFPADKEGQVYIVDFVCALDLVYKKLRLLENAINNASHIDKSYEKVINVCFYFVIGCIVLAALNFDPLGFIISFSTIIVSFGFMIGSGTSQLFEGLLLVLTRQPYDIGDKIAIASPDDPANLDGSAHWIVQSVDLVTTVAKLVGTNEVASFSNGSLARMRLINMNRSPDAIVYVRARFALDVPYSTIMIFRSAVEKYIDDRPQEWIGMVGFRTNRVQVEMNFVEYHIVLKHQAKWQSLLTIKESLGQVSAFCVEAQKQLGCRYQSPSMGVEISMKSNESGSKETEPGAEKEKQVNDNAVKRLMNLAGIFGSKKDE